MTAVVASARAHRSRRSRARGRSGMSLIETLMATTVATLVMVPLLGWASFAMREQVDAQARTLDAAGLGLLRTWIARDVPPAEAVWSASASEKVRPALRDCEGGAGADGTVLMEVVAPEVSILYTVAPGSEGGRSLWRRSCAAPGAKVLDEVELVGGLADAAVECPGVDPAVAPCRQVVLSLTGEDGRATVLSASVRADGPLDGGGGGGTAPEAPTVVLSAEPTSGERGMTVRFSAAGSSDPDGGGLGYFWEFGDGATSTEERPQHRYTQVGSFTAVLTVTSAAGVPATEFVTVRVANRAPTAVIAAPADGTSVFRGQPVAFSSNGSGDGPDAEFGGRIVAWSWDFGDGTTSTAANPTKTYTALSPPGGYTVRLTVTDDGGLTAQARTSVVVANRAPSVVLDATPSSGPSPLAVTLTSTVTDETTLGTNPPLTYAWDLGDGRTSTAANPGVVTYTGSGTRTVRVTVTDDAGATATATRTITVNSPPVASFALSPTSGRAPRSVSFTNSSSDPDGTITAWSWNFGNGATSTAATPTAQTFTFDDAASDTFVSRAYVVTLTVTDNRGATATTTRTVTITGAPAPANLRRTGSGQSGGRRFLDLAWNSVSTVNRYQVEVVCTSNNCTDAVTTETTGTTVRVSNLTNGSRNYNVRVRARDTTTGKWGAWSTTLATNT